jgi:ribosome-binding protein aMBF1 (putative translation factor)
MPLLEISYTSLVYYGVLVPEPEDRAAQRRRVFGQQLRKARRVKGWTQTDLAARAGLDRSHLSEIEHGKHAITIERVYALADALDVPISTLLLDDA